jgi:hypothetical protein
MRDAAAEKCTMTTKRSLLLLLQTMCVSREAAAKMGNERLKLSECHCLLISRVRVREEKKAGIVCRVCCMRCDAMCVCSVC